MAKLNIRIPTTGLEFETEDVDFSQITPQRIIENMRGEILHDPGENMGWRMLRGSQVVNQDATLEDLGFRDGDTADLMAKVEGA